MIVVIPSGASVVVTGQSTGGYLAVTWSSYKGYAHGDWIRTGGTPQPVPAQPPVLPATGTAVTTSSLNMRAGAGTTFTVLTVMPAGATVTLTGQSVARLPCGVTEEDVDLEVLLEGLALEQGRLEGVAQRADRISEDVVEHPDDRG